MAGSALMTLAISETGASRRTSSIRRRATVGSEGRRLHPLMRSMSGRAIVPRLLLTARATGDTAASGQRWTFPDSYRQGDLLTYQCLVGLREGRWILGRRGRGTKHKDSKGTKDTKSNSVHCARRVSAVFVSIFSIEKLGTGCVPRNCLK